MADNILEIPEYGSFYKRSEDGYLMVVPNNDYETNDWGIVEDFYPFVVEKVNAHFGTNYIANCED